MGPEPALRFTIPSLHDGLSLDCRVYHPASLAATNVRAAPWKKHAAVMAHPYGPMGGCYDDPVLGSIAARLLGAGCLVGTFNFRGAGHSAGRTSWTARPERDDYASMVGFTAYYVHFLDPFSQPVRQDKEDADADTAAEEPTTTTTQPRSVSETSEQPWLLMGGYSYGAMVTTLLPPIEELLSPFSSPEADSHAAQIRLRAQHLAEQQNLILGGMRAAMLQVPNPRHPERRHSGGVRIGGEEGGRSPRKSHDSHGPSRISLDAEDRIRRGVHDLVARRKAQHPLHHWNWTLTRSRSGGSGAELRDGEPRREQSASEAAAAAAAAAAGGGGGGGGGRGGRESPTKHPSGEHPSGEQEPQLQRLPTVSHFVCPRPAYILVSPLQGLVAHLATMSLLPSHSHTHDEPAEKKLVENPTLAVFGDKDVFVPVGKLRTWAARLSAGSSRFTAWEVPCAGHFWTEEGVLQGLTERVGEFAGSLA
ncbi:hypothetical protein E4U53_001884 [Claviceps sorghi]|nr:hypothetical protein E4U53_001884 [Claviceps sorghi]